MLWMNTNIVQEREALMILAMNKTELGGEQVFVRGEKGVAVNLLIDDGEIQFVRPGEECRVYCSAADHKNAILIHERCKCRLDRAECLNSLDGCGTKNNESPVWKRSTDGFVGLASHEHGVAGGESLEAFQVFRNVPGKIPLRSDHAVLPDGNDDGEFHTATSNLIGS